MGSYDAIMGAILFAIVFWAIITLAALYPNGVY
jgi:hypothetical protein